MNVTEMLKRIARDPDGIVSPAVGQPNIDPSHIVPEDVRECYDVCGGLVIARGSPYEARVVVPDECVLANDVILGRFATIAREQLSGNASWGWYTIAEVENGNYLAIDFGLPHNGRCYDAFWETYALLGQMPVVATAFSTLVEQLYENKGTYWYWLEPGFRALGDAYDAT